MPRAAHTDAPVRYRIEPQSLHAHLYAVTLEIDQPAPQQVVSLPVWIPGSYLVREFARHLQGLQARQGRRALAVRQLDKCTWQVDCDPQQPLRLQYQVYAYDSSVRAAWLDARRGFFNGTSLCLRAHGQEDRPHTLQLDRGAAPADWEVATGLQAHAIDRRGFGLYRARDYDELVDCPVELGRFWHGEFEAGSTPHLFIVSGAPPSFDGERLLADAQRICETVIRFWHPGGRRRRGDRPPFDRYVFLLQASDDGYGGLEHRNSTALLCARRDLPRHGQPAGEGYTTLLGLISHEYFHTWNVKRLRPAEFAHYDYSRENYTELLWFFEGYTSYYDDLLLRRAGLIDNATYLRLLGKTINQLLQTPGRRVQTVAQASFDAWIKYYRVDENTPNATVSYYGKGALVALCLDLSLRAQGHGSLDEVMRALWQRCAGGPMREDDLLAVLQERTGRSWAAELRRWVHSTAELPLQPLLAGQGVSITLEPAPLAQRLGLRVQESNGLHIKTVLRGGAAEQAGMAAGDEWVAVEAGRERSLWRMQRLDDLLLYAGTQTRLHVWVARDRQLLRLPLRLPEQARTWQLGVGLLEQVNAWLGG
jgi:predicted metalloprotease with PDZ domain